MEWKHWAAAPSRPSLIPPQRLSCSGWWLTRRPRPDSEHSGALSPKWAVFFRPLPTKLRALRREGVGRLLEPEVTDDSKDILTHNRADCVNPQRLVHQTRQAPALRKGRGPKVPLLIKKQFAGKGKNNFSNGVSLSLLHTPG